MTPDFSFNQDAEKNLLEEVIELKNSGIGWDKLTFRNTETKEKTTISAIWNEAFTEFGKQKQNFGEKLRPGEKELAEFTVFYDNPSSRYQLETPSGYIDVTQIRFIFYLHFQQTEHPIIPIQYEELSNDKIISRIINTSIKINEQDITFDLINLVKGNKFFIIGETNDQND